MSASLWLAYGIFTACCIIYCVVLLVWMFWELTDEWRAGVRGWLWRKLRGWSRRLRSIKRRFGKPPLVRGYVWAWGGSAESLGGECPNCWRGEFARVGSGVGQYAVCRVCYHRWNTWDDPWTFAGYAPEYNELRVQARYYQWRRLAA